MIVIKPFFIRILKSEKSIVDLDAILDLQVHCTVYTYIMIISAYGLLLSY